MMMPLTAVALAHPNIAFIKYWGDRDGRLHLPANGSISMNLGGLFTRTRVAFDPSLPQDCLILNDCQVGGEALRRVSSFLDHIRRLAGIELHAEVQSENNFPTGAGIASSASAFAALALAASSAAGLNLDEPQLSRLARLGSGSACRSVPGGFVEWQAGSGDEESYAFSLAPPDHWNLADCIVLVHRGHKEVVSASGHRLAHTSPLQPGRVADAPRRLEVCRQAILERDFDALAHISELDCIWMHAVMQTSTPPLLYWQPQTLEVMHSVIRWRKAGLPAFYTIDAGPNVHVICPQIHAELLAERLRALPGQPQVLIALPGGPARLALA